MNSLGRVSWRLSVPSSCSLPPLSLALPGLVAPEDPQTPRSYRPSGSLSDLRCTSFCTQSGLPRFPDLNDTILIVVRDTISTTQFWLWSPTNKQAVIASMPTFYKVNNFLCDTNFLLKMEKDNNGKYSKSMCGYIQSCSVVWGNVWVSLRKCVSFISLTGRQVAAP